MGAMHAGLGCRSQEMEGRGRLVPGSCADQGNAVNTFEVAKPQRGGDALLAGPCLGAAVQQVQRHVVAQQPATVVFPVCAMHCT